MTKPLLVFPTKFTAGIDAITNGVPVNRSGKTPGMGRVWPSGLEAFRHTFDTDAHCVCYQIPGEAPQHGRLNKRALPDLLRAGLEPVLNWVLVDVDNAFHKPWTDPAAAWPGLLASLTAAGDYAAGAGCYMTGHGYRLVWPLSRPVPVSDSEHRLRGVIQHLRDRGIAADPACSDWTRFYRMPRVRRDGSDVRLPLEL